MVTRTPFNLNDAAIMKTGSTKLYPVGSLAYCSWNGSEGLFRYVRNKFGNALVLGNVLTMIDHSTVGNFRASANVYTAPASSASGKPELTLNDPSGSGVVTTTVTANEYAGIAGIITVGTGINQHFTVVGNEAATATDKLKLYLAQPLVTTPAAADDIQLLPFNLMRKTTDLLEQPAGVAVSAPADGEYFWMMVKGVTDVIVEPSTTLTGGVLSAALFPATTDGNAIIGLAGHTPEAVTSYGHMTLIQKIGAGNTTGIALINMPPPWSI
jgi:hypothetical protein